MARTLQFRIYFYRTARGESEVRTFLRKLPRKHRIKCYQYLNRVREFGMNQPNIYVEKLDDNLWEVKPEYNNIEYRFLCGIIGQGRVGVVDALKKKRERLPRAVLDHAMKRIVDMKG